MIELRIRITRTREGRASEMACFPARTVNSVSRRGRTFLRSIVLIRQSRGVMRRVKVRAEDVWNNIALLAGAIVLACVLSLILFGVMFAAAYVADEFCGVYAVSTDQRPSAISWLGTRFSAANGASR
jgi:hypothetical protein